MQSGVAVEKLTFRLKEPKFGDRKCPGDPRKSIVGHPDAITFLRILREGVFQQPRLISSTGRRVLRKGVSHRFADAKWKTAEGLRTGLRIQGGKAGG
jgi:hypothetical protein